jgi:hypothetical protein
MHARGATLRKAQRSGFRTSTDLAVAARCTTNASLSLPKPNKTSFATLRMLARQVEPVMRQPCGARLAGVGGLLLWLLTATLLMKASPAAAGCPFRHGLRFADDPGVPKPPTVDTPAVTQYSSHEGTKSSGQDLEAHVAHATSPQGSTSRTNVARRLKGLIGLGVDLGLDQSLTKDTITTAPRATREKVNRTATPYLLFPYGRPNRPSSPLDKDWASVVSACKVRPRTDPKTVAGCASEHAFRKMPLLGACLAAGTSENS